MKYLIFDIDGTLTNTKEVDDKCFIKAFEETFTIDIMNEKWEDLENVTDWGITEEIIQRERGKKPMAAQYDLMISNHVQNLQLERIKDKSQFGEVSGAKQFFDQLRSFQDIKLGIATGAWEASAKLKLETIGIDLEGICFSNSTYHKSREDITKDVISQLNSKSQQEPDEIVYFGDGEWDFKTCKNLDIRFIGIDIEGDGKLIQLGAKSVFRNYRDMDKILNAIDEDR